MLNIKRKLARLPGGVLSRSKGFYRRLVVFVKRRPMTGFFLILGLLLLLIVGGNLTSKKVETEKPEIVKTVQIYQIGESPKVTLAAKIEKSGVVKINALAPGIIQSINFYEGEEVSKGAVLVNMSSNYQGGNAASLQRQLAFKQYQNTKETIATQRELITKQKEVAEKSETSSNDLRVITDQSLGETRDLINLNQGIVDTLTQNQKNLESNNPGGINDATILQLRTQRAGIQTGLNQLRSGLRLAEMSSSNDKPPAELARLQKDIAVKQLDLQQKALDLGLEISRLQLALASVNEALYYPSSPFAALIQRVHVKVGQSVNPGTPLLTISAVEDPITAIVSLPYNLAGAVSNVEPSIVHFGDQTIELLPIFISTEATDGVLYSVIYMIPDQYSQKLVDGGNISVEIPVGISEQTSSSIPFVPLDSVYQSADQSIVLVAEGEWAVSKKVELGDIFGRFVEVRSGLTSSDQVILNRNILAGDKISIPSK